MSSAQFIEVLPINEGNGYVALQTDEVQMIHGYKSIYHGIEISSYLKTLETLKSAVKQFPGEVSNQIKLNINKLDRELLFFRINRRKRGLFNVVGKGLKFLTGNLDEDDAEEIGSRLKSIEENEENVVNFNNNLYKFNEHLDSELANLTNHINSETTMLNKLSKKVSQSINEIQYKLDLKIAMDSLGMNIQLFLSHVIEIKQAISFSKVGILSANLLDEDDINNLTIDQYKNIKTGLFQDHESNVLFFVVKIPLYSDKKYFDLIIEPIPNFNKKQLYKEENVNYITNNNTIFVKDNEESKLRIPLDNCIANILNNQKTSCKFIDFTNSAIAQLTDNIIVTKNLIKTKITHDCNFRKYEIVFGNNIIKFYNCTVMINNITFSAFKDKRYEHLLLPLINENIEVNTEPIMSLEMVHHNSNQAIKELTLIRYKTDHSMFVSYSGLAIIVILILSIILYLTCKCKGKQTAVVINGNELEINRIHGEVRIRQESNLNQGGVTACDPLQRIQQHYGREEPTGDEGNPLNPFSRSSQRNVRRSSILNRPNNI